MMFDPRQPVEGEMNLGARNLIRLTFALMEESEVKFIYENVAGEISTRHVIPTSIERRDNGETILSAHDCIRQEHRSFRLPQIKYVGP